VLSDQGVLGQPHLLRGHPENPQTGLEVEAHALGDGGGQGDETSLRGVLAGSQRAGDGRCSRARFPPVQPRPVGRVGTRQSGGDRRAELGRLLECREVPLVTQTYLADLYGTVW
jgi:hypothetical protein